MRGPALLNKIMTPIERFNLAWLIYAMTDTPDNHKRYYYDSKNARFFHLEIPAHRDGAIEFYDAIGLTLAGELYHDLFMRLENPYAKSSDIMEIRRLSKDQKMDIQLQFLNRIGCKNYLCSVTLQRAEDHFIMDEVMAEQENSLLYALWEKFKLEVARHYINNSSKATGISVNLLC